MKTFPALFCASLVWLLLYLALGWTYNTLDENAHVAETFHKHFGWWILFFILLFIGFKFKPQNL